VSRGALLAMLSLAIASLALAALPRAQRPFELSPMEFTARDVPVGRFCRLERKLVIVNKDNVERAFSVAVKRPPENEVREGYSPIPETTWFYFIVDGSTSVENAVVMVRENSWAEVEMALSLPPWENLTNQRWEAWISVTRQPLAGEILAIEYISRAKIETAELVGTERKSLLIAAAAVAGTAIVALLLGWLARRRRAMKRRPTLLRVLLTGFLPFCSNLFKNKSRVSLSLHLRWY
jgi:hypothetical protein